MLGLILLSLKLIMFTKSRKGEGANPLWIPVPMKLSHNGGRAT